MAKTMKVTMACGAYDRTIPIQDGSVEAEGLDIEFHATTPGPLFRQQARESTFDVSEFSLATYAMLTSRGDDRFVALPVFPSRKFRHSHVFVADPHIEHPRHLAGGAIGCSEYQQTASTWARGILSDDYGLTAQDVEWFFGGLNEPKPDGDRIPIEYPPQLVTHRIPPDRTLNEMLVQGELDAIVDARAPAALSSGHARRLFTDYEAEERSYYDRTGIFPIMHLVVIRASLYEANPWMARSLARAFEQAKEVGDRRLRDPGGLYCALPWLPAHLEVTDARSKGRDWFAYGLEPNRHVLETFLRYCREQGLLERPLTADELFVEV